LADRQAQLAELSRRAAETGDEHSMAVIRDLSARLKDLAAAADVQQDDLQKHLDFYAAYKVAHQAALEWSLSAQLKLASVNDVTGTVAELHSRQAAAQVGGKYLLFYLYFSDR
jgi:hypothetical protein